jgi:outer membrane protein insertion porin family
MRTKIVALLSMLLFCIGGAFAQTTDDWYFGKPIRAVSFEGLKNVSDTELDGVFASYLGKNFSDELYWEMLQKMYALEYFDDITPMALPGDSKRETVLLQFTVVEKPVITAIVIDGNKEIRDGDLLEKITLKKGDIYNELKSRMDERAVRDYYLDKGYAGVKITSEAVLNAEKKTISLNFSITEGKKTVVSEINFEGNKIMATKTLKNTLKLKEAKFLSSGTFRELDLEADKLAIKRYYLERGYVDATVENVLREVDSETDPEKNLLKLTFLIKEGEQYTYGGTEITGNSVYTTDELLANIKLKEGDVLNLNRYEEEYQAIADMYFETGYTSNYIGRTEKRDADRKRISYAIQIVESDRSHIEHILIKGNTKTKEGVITRELKLEQGDIFSKGKLLSSLRNLYNLRYFSVVSPELVEGSEKNLVDVVINLEEQSTASVQFGVTFSGVADADTFPLTVFVTWEDKNFIGNGQTVSASLNASPDTQSLSLGMSENWFLGSPLTVSFNVSVTHRELYAYQDLMFPVYGDSFYNDNGIVPDQFSTLDEYDDASSVDSSYRMKYDRWSYGVGASTGYRWNPRMATVSLMGGVNFGVVQNFYDAMLYRPADKEIRDQHGAWNLNNSVWTKLSLDDRDLYYDPSKGWFTSQQVTLFGIIPEQETTYYAKFDTKLEGYLTLLDVPLTDVFSLKFVLAASSGLSFLVPTTDAPISDSNKLYVDGMFTGWGWQTLYSQADARGDMMLTHRLELRMPLAVGVISADFFLDAVAPLKNRGDLSGVTLDSYYMSFGPGLRFSIPQFPLRLLFANTFRIQNGNFEWGNGEGPDWKFVLSFNISNQ